MNHAYDIQKVLTQKTEQVKLEYKSQNWTEFRRNGIGGSDAAAAIGLSKWKTNVQLWEEKTGLAIAKDVHNDRVEYGLRAESHILRLFELDHKDEYKVVEYKDTVFQKGFMFASVDGGLINKKTGELGGIEIKTAEPMTRSAWEEWDNMIPMPYYIQILHYLAVTDWSFWIVKTRLIGRDQDNRPIITEKEYLFDRAEESGNIEFLISKEIQFWEHVKNGTRPNALLPKL